MNITKQLIMEKCILFPQTYDDNKK